MLEDLNNIKNDIKDYIEVRLDLIKLHTAENISRIVSNAASYAIIGYLLFFILLFLSLAGGYYFASLLNSNELGFLCIAGIYVLILALFLIFRNHLIEKPVIKAIVKLFFPTPDKDENKP